MGVGEREHGRSGSEWSHVLDCERLCRASPAVARGLSRERRRPLRAPRPPLHTWRPQPRRHTVHDRRHDLPVGMDSAQSVRPSPSQGPRSSRAWRRMAFGGRASGYEYDHLVPLELGGAVNDPRNLWPEADYLSHVGFYRNPKDRLENGLRRMVCARTMTLAQAQRAIAYNWVAEYRRLRARSSGSVRASHDSSVADSRPTPSAGNPSRRRRELTGAMRVCPSDLDLRVDDGAGRGGSLRSH